ncbi:hypothetical protein AAIP58_000076 [Flavobacterium psychrophilum]|nr:hypothetical protein [Flavobacterium psychrophilum]
MNSNAPSISTFTREKGRAFTEGLVMGWLMYLNGILNLNKPMTEDQIEMCATEIVNDYGSLKISDMTLIFKRIMTGQYGEFFESISTAKVISWFRDYFNERCDIAEDESFRQHSDFSSNEEFNFSTNIKRIMQTGAKYSSK